MFNNINNITNFISLIIIPFYIWRHFKLKLNLNLNLALMTVGLSVWNLTVNSFIGNLISSEVSLSHDVKVFGIILEGIILSSIFLYTTSDCIKNRYRKYQEKQGQDPEIMVSKLKLACNCIVYFIGSMVFVSMLIPDYLRINSCYSLWSTSNFATKFDVLYWGANITFATIILSKISHWCLMTPFSIIGYFTVIYNGFIVILSNICLIMSNDIITHLSNSINGDRVLHDPEINLITSMVINFFNHLNCFQSCSGSTREIIISEISNFKELVTNSLLVLNTAGFVIIPFFLWVIVIESR